jgi:geranylgeranyl diphosphate synthase type I
LCEGQYLDILYESKFDININDYILMTDLKTASLITCSVRLGALLGTNDEAMVLRFERFGRKLGMAYQMIDDVLGIWGDEPFSDILKKKKTLPIIYALEHAGDKDRSKLLEIYNRKSINQTGVRQVIGILNRLKAEEYSRQIAQQYYNEGLAELGESGLSATTCRELKDVTDFLMDREY